MTVLHNFYIQMSMTFLRYTLDDLMRLNSQRNFLHFATQKAIVRPCFHIHHFHFTVSFNCILLEKLAS